MADVPGQSGVRPEIELAWRRARMAGLDPGMEVQGSVLSDIDRRSRLVVAAEPVLDRIAQDLVDTRFSVLLADSASVIVDRRYGERSLTVALDRVMAVPGSRYTEAVSGTNERGAEHARSAAGRTRRHHQGGGASAHGQDGAHHRDGSVHLRRP